ncbi:MAG: hypothetical protein ACRYGP_13720 [Janthinobacterium lividum]
MSIALELSSFHIPGRSFDCPVSSGSSCAPDAPNRAQGSAVARVAPSAATCRRAWGEIRALYRLKDLLVPA